MHEDLFEEDSKAVSRSILMVTSTEDIGMTEVNVPWIVVGLAVIAVLLGASVVQYGVAAARHRPLPCTLRRLAEAGTSRSVGPPAFRPGNCARPSMMPRPNRRGHRRGHPTRHRSSTPVSPRSSDDFEDGAKQEAANHPSRDDVHEQREPMQEREGVVRSPSGPAGASRVRM